MDFSAIITAAITAIITLLGGKIVVSSIQRKKLWAQAEKIGIGNLQSIITSMREEIDRTKGHVGKLEERLTLLEKENEDLREQVAEFRSLVVRLWAIVCENDLEADEELVKAVKEALEDGGQ